MALKIFERIKRRQLPAKKHIFDLTELLNILTIIAFTIGIIALLTMIWLYVRPVKTADIKVPVATDQASYYPGEAISGIFFGDTYYSGEVRVLREVFCKDYHGVIMPPKNSADGDFFSTISKPRHLEGASIPVGNLPTNIPEGANCVLQFTNVYQEQTPFGIRHLEYQYYTQNFSIVTKARRMQLDCEASGKKHCNFLFDIPKEQPESEWGIAPVSQSSPETMPATTPTPSSSPSSNSSSSSKSSSTSTPTEQRPNEPSPRYVERCTIDILGIQLGCRQVQVN